MPNIKKRLRFTVTAFPYILMARLPKLCHNSQQYNTNGHYQYYGSVKNQTNPGRGTSVDSSAAGFGAGSHIGFLLP